MKADGTKFLQCFLLVFLIVSTISPAEESSIPEAVIEQKDWKVGVSIFQVEKNDPALAAAASLIPRLILDELTGIAFHKLTDAERNFLIQDSVRKKELEALSLLSSKFALRDRLLFDINSDSRQLKKIEEQISSAYSELRYWQGSPSAPADVPEELPVEFPSPPGGGGFWTLEGFAPDACRENAGLDVLIVGTVVRVGDYFGIRISALGPTGEDVLWEGAGEDGELESISAEAAAAARGLVLGRPWASLTVHTEPPEAVLTRNGHNVGVGVWSDSNLNPGSLIVEITASGYRPEVLNITLVPDEIRVINVNLEKTDLAQVLINSEPEGASLRLGSIWIGKTPLSLDQPDRVMPVTLEKEGYITRTLPLYPESERLTVPLSYSLQDPVDEMAVSRKKLYSSIAWFSFSLAPTVILLGVSQNFANMNLNSTTPEDLDYSYKAYQISYGMMWGSIAVNVGLLTNVIFKLVRYLKAAEELSN